MPLADPNIEILKLAVDQLESSGDSIPNELLAIGIGILFSIP
jgi:hypothetical protein